MSEESRGEHFGREELVLPLQLQLRCLSALVHAGQSERHVAELKVDGLAETSRAPGQRELQLGRVPLAHPERVLSVERHQQPARPACEEPGRGHFGMDRVGLMAEQPRRRLDALDQRPSVRRAVDRFHARRKRDKLLVLPVVLGQKPGGNEQDGQQAKHARSRRSRHQSAPRGIRRRKETKGMMPRPPHDPSHTILAADRGRVDDSDGFDTVRSAQAVGVRWRSLTAAGSCLMVQNCAWTG